MLNAYTFHLSVEFLLFDNSFEFLVTRTFDMCTVFFSLYLNHLVLWIRIPQLCSLFSAPTFLLFHKAFPFKSCLHHFFSVSLCVFSEIIFLTPPACLLLLFILNRSFLLDDVEFFFSSTFFFSPVVAIL